MKFEDEFFVDRSKTKDLMGSFFVVSVLLHVIFFCIQSISPLPKEVKEPESIPIEVANIPKEQLQAMEKQFAQKIKAPSKEKQIVESEKAKNEEIDPNAKFLSDKNQKVEKQTKAARIDDFHEKQGTGAKGKHADTPSEKEEITTDVGLTPAKPAAKKNWKSLTLQDLSVGNGDGGKVAASDDRLEGVDHGERTMLSTREFKYFSYYHRIKELLRQHWKPEVEHQIERIWRKGRNITSDELTTKVLVTLNEKGNLTKISKLSGSGFTEIDEAAIEAFQKAAPFPNPPQAMVEEDGFVRIRWDFILTADSGPRIQFRNAGSDPRY